MLRPNAAHTPPYNAFDHPTNAPLLRMATQPSRSASPAVLAEPKPLPFPLIAINRNMYEPAYWYGVGELPAGLGDPDSFQPQPLPFPVLAISPMVYHPLHWYNTGPTLPAPVPAPVIALAPVMAAPAPAPTPTPASAATSSSAPASTSATVSNTASLPARVHMQALPKSSKPTPGSYGAFGQERSTGSAPVASVSQQTVAEPSFMVKAERVSPAKAAPEPVANLTPNFAPPFSFGNKSASTASVAPTAGNDRDSIRASSRAASAPAEPAVTPSAPAPSTAPIPSAVGMHPARASMIASAPLPEASDVQPPALSAKAAGKRRAEDFPGAEDQEAKRSRGEEPSSIPTNPVQGEEQPQSKQQPPAKKVKQVPNPPGTGKKAKRTAKKLAEEAQLREQAERLAIKRAEERNEWLYQEQARLRDEENARVAALTAAKLTASPVTIEAPLGPAKLAASPLVVSAPLGPPSSSTVIPAEAQETAVEPAPEVGPSTTTPQPASAQIGQTAQEQKELLLQLKLRAQQSLRMKEAKLKRQQKSSLEQTSAAASAGSTPKQAEQPGMLRSFMKSLWPRLGEQASAEESSASTSADVEMTDADEAEGEMAMTSPTAALQKFAAEFDEAVRQEVPSGPSTAVPVEATPSAPLEVQPAPSKTAKRRKKPVVEEGEVSSDEDELEVLFEDDYDFGYTPPPFIVNRPSTSRTSSITGVKIAEKSSQPATTGKGLARKPAMSSAVSEAAVPSAEASVSSEAEPAPAMLTEGAVTETRKDIASEPAASLKGPEQAIFRAKVVTPSAVPSSASTDATGSSNGKDDIIAAASAPLTAAVSQLISTVPAASPLPPTTSTNDVASGPIKPNVAPSLPTGPRNPGTRVPAPAAKPAAKVDNQQEVRPVAKGKAKLASTLKPLPGAVPHKPAFGAQTPPTAGQTPKQASTKPVSFGSAGSAASKPSSTDQRLESRRSPRSKVATSKPDVERIKSHFQRSPPPHIGSIPPRAPVSSASAARQEASALPHDNFTAEPRSPSNSPPASSRVATSAGESALPANGAVKLLERMTSGSPSRDGGASSAAPVKSLAERITKRKPALLDRMR